jgi:hypothetical protein
MSTDAFKLRNLRGAICEYIDEGNIDELLSDLKNVLEEEEQDFLNKAKLYKSVRRQLFK